MTDSTWPPPSPLSDSSEPVVSDSSELVETDDLRRPNIFDRTAEPMPEHFSEDDADALIGVSFDKLMKAEEFLLALNRLSSDGELKLRDAVLVVKDQEGKVRVRETLDPQPGRAALSGAMWSGLLGLILGGPVGWLAGLGIGAGTGAITARFVDLGIPDDWVAWFKAAVQPQTATVIVMAGNININALHAEARRFAGADLVHTTLKPGVEEALADAFEHDVAQSDGRVAR